MGGSPARVACLLVVILLAPARGAAGDSPTAGDPPWATGVTPEARARAQELLVAGNQLFLDGHPRDALATYEQALAAWDHPAIRFNMVRTLIALDRPVDAFDNLERALRYGAAPLDEQLYAEALNYQRLLAAQIGSLVVTCTQPGVAITLDGVALGAPCPTSIHRRVTPGEHDLVGRAAGFLDATVRLVVVGGRDTPAAITLVSIADVTVQERRWAAWKPWAVVGAGVGVLGVGAVLARQSAANSDAYAAELERQCGETGCAPGTLSAPTEALADRAASQHTWALGAFVAGGATLLAGAALVWLNQPRAVVPMIEASGGLGVGVRGAF